MDMTQRRAYENQVLSREKPLSVTIRLGAVSDLIRAAAGNSSFARNTFQQFGQSITS
jgi:hypothetical protein